MNALKKLMGICWMLMAPCIIVFMIAQAAAKIETAAPGTATVNTALQWGIILLVFIPICCGFILFGYYSWKGEYSRLPSSSSEID